MKATVPKTLLNFPPILPLFIRGLCRQSHLHSCKEGNYKFPNLFLEKKKKWRETFIHRHPVWRKGSSRICQHRRLQCLRLQVLNVNADHLKMGILYLDWQELPTLSRQGRGRSPPFSSVLWLRVALGKLHGKWKCGPVDTDRCCYYRWF